MACHLGRAGIPWMESFGSLHVRAGGDTDRAGWCRHRMGASECATPHGLRWAVATAVLGLVVALASPARNRVRLAHNGHRLLRSAPGHDKLSPSTRGESTRMGVPSASSTLARPKQSPISGSKPSWPGTLTVTSRTSLAAGKVTQTTKPIVLFEPYGAGWKVRRFTPTVPAARDYRQLQRLADRHSVRRPARVVLPRRRWPAHPERIGASDMPIGGQLLLASSEAERRTLRSS